MKHTSKLSKKLTTAVISLALLFGIVIMGSPIFTKLPVFAVSDKVTICHATSSETNQYETIVVSINAIGGHFDNPGTPKSGHEDDLLFFYETECPGTEISVTPTVTPTQTPSPTPTKTPSCGCTPDEDDDPTITPRPTFAPTHTPTPTQGQVNEPTATPGAGAPTATPTPTPTPGPIGGGSTDNGSSSTGTVAGTTASTTQGQVLGASTTSLPNTGGFYEMISLLMTSCGSMLMAGSLFSYAKTKKENK